MNNAISVNSNKKGKKPYSLNTRTMTAMLAAVSYALAFLEFPVPLSPSFARMDLSDFPALIGALALGPVSGLVIEFVKNALQLLSTSTNGIGELANFLIGGSFVCVAGLIDKIHQTKRTAWIACIMSSIVMGIVSALTNYFLLLPVFEIFMPPEQVIASFGAFIPLIQTKLDVVLYHAFPFNLSKGLIIGGFTMIIDQRLSPY